MKTLFAVLLLLFYISLILVVIFAERKRPTEALLWVIVVVCIPYLGAILYLIFGNTVGIKLTAYLRKKRVKFNMQKQLLPKSAKISSEDEEVIRFNAVYNKSELTCYDTAEFFTNGKDHYAQLFGDIKRAKENIFVEFYTIHDDEVGNAFVKALAEKAKEGVEVLVLIDFIANLSSPRSMFMPLREAGGKFIRVKPYLTHYRSHRKIVTIDHKISYIGGMNIGKQYANLAKKKNPWRDTQIRLTGSCTRILDEYFLSDWLYSIKRRDCEKTLEHVKPMFQVRGNMNKNLCQFVVGGVDTRKEGVKMNYLSLIRSAKSNIRIQTPYFIPDASVLDALKTAAASGVQVELMIPGIKASFFLDPVTNYYCGQLLEYGAKVYKYNGYIHAKTMVIDNEMCCIGSVNMDMRSLMVDDEVCGVFYQNALVNEYRKIYDDDILDTKPYTLQMFKSRTTWDKFCEAVFMPFAPLF